MCGASPRISNMQGSLAECDEANIARQACGQSQVAPHWVGVGGGDVCCVLGLGALAPTFPIDTPRFACRIQVPMRR